MKKRYFNVPALFVAGVFLIAILFFFSCVTPPKDDKSPQISDVSITFISDTDVEVKWVTDKPTTSDVSICEPDGVCRWGEPNKTMVKNHLMIVKNIKKNIDYRFVIKSIDASNNEAIFEKHYTLADINPTKGITDTTSPVISEVLVIDTPVGSNEGMQAPDFTLKNLQGKDVSLKDFRGKIVIVDFWFVDCPPCIPGIWLLQELLDNWSGAKEIVVLAINNKDSQTKIQNWLLGRRCSVDILLDSDAKVTKQYSVKTCPRYFFIKTDGVIVKEKGSFHSLDEILEILKSI